MSVERVRADPDWTKIEAFLAWLRNHAPEGLARVRDARRWCSWELTRANGAHCLVGHAGAWHTARDGEPAARDPRVPRYFPQPTWEFDRLAHIHGLAPVVAAVQIRAAELLAEGGQP